MAVETPEIPLQLNQIPDTTSNHIVLKNWCIFSSSKCTVIIVRILTKIDLTVRPLEYPLMIAYWKTYEEFHKDIISNRIEEEIVSHLGFNVSDSEKRSFRNSLPAIHTALQNCDIPGDVEVALEFKVPLTNKRVDFIIAGSDDEGKDHLVICELKQWESVTHTDMHDIVTVRGQEKVHPSWQAYDYGSLISHFNEYVETGEVDIETCTFLHNYKRQYADELLDEIYKEGISKAKPFISDQFEDLAKFISRYIRRPSKNRIIFEVENGRICPSKMLANCLGNLLKGSDDFTLIDEQRIVYSNLFKEATASLKNRGPKNVFVVRGGAGTGKSLIAMKLMGSLIEEKGNTVFYVAKSSYVKEAYFKKLTKDIPDYRFLRSLFQGSGNFIDRPLNDVEILIVDEAHRLMEKTKVSHWFKGENQIREIIHAARTSIFFIDETQNIDIKDFGTIEHIKDAAEAEGAIFHCDDKYILRSQFRCNGSDEYIAWLDAILYNKQYEPSGMYVDYDIRIIDDVCVMRDLIKEKNANSKIPSRILSGDVFEWKSKKDKNAIDIVIGDFQAQWNRTKSFATDSRSIDEVGCIHTSQGMEFEYAGIIIGDDLIYREGEIKTDFTKHPAGAGEFKRPYRKKILPSDDKLIEQLIRNTYKVLLTRGQKGCYIYVMDPELKTYLKKSIKNLLGDRGNCS